VAICFINIRIQILAIIGESLITSQLICFQNYDFTSKYKTFEFCNNASYMLVRNKTEKYFCRQGY
jgi:hypothetical protein